MPEAFTEAEMESVQAIFDRDPLPAPAPPLRETSRRSFGLDDIPIDRYTSADFHRLEMERLWSRVWQWACREEDIPSVGDHTVYDIGDRSVLLVRSGPDRIQAFYNSCLHRGTQLKEEPGSSPTLTCSFHGWSWNLDGSLARIPCRWDFPQVSDERFALPEVRSQRWGGFVFINFDDSAPPLLEALDIIPDHFAHFALDDRFTAVNVSKVIPANWKVGVEAFIESYHVIQTHPELLEWNADANTQYDVWRNASRLITPLGVASPHLGGPAYDQDAVLHAAMPFFAPGVPAEALPRRADDESPRTVIAEFARQAIGGAMGLDFSGTSIAEMIDGVQYFVFPNWFPWAGATYGVQYRFRPNGNDHDSALMEVRLLARCPPGAERPPAAPVHHLGPDEPWSAAEELGGFAPILDQDMANLRRLQRGLKASHKGTVTLGEYQESRNRHFHHVLDRYLSDGA